jgi:GntR family transcriptional regulator
MRWDAEDLTTGPVPLWFQIAGRLREAIRARQFEPGDRLPSEAELNLRFGVSRTTARSALDHLEHEGLILRRSGKGSIVQPLRVDQPLKALTGFGDDMRARGLTPSYRTREVRRVSAVAEVARALGFDRGTPVLTIDRLLCADGSPIAVSQSWLPALLFKRRRPPGAQELDTGSLYAWLERNNGLRIVSGEEFIEAANAEIALARRLEIPTGSAVLVARRVSRTATGQAVEYVVLHYRADRYRFRVELGRL